MKHLERTLVVFKPDSVQRGIVGEVLARFERVGLKIVGMKMIKPGYDHYFYHYETIGKLMTRANKKVLESAIDLMSQGPVIAVVLEGVEAVALVRKMCGTTEPKNAQPGTIRGDYSHISMAHANEVGAHVANILHASGNKEEADTEIDHWFSKSELFDYKTTHEKFTHGKK